MFLLNKDNNLHTFVVIKDSSLCTNKRLEVSCWGWAEIDLFNGESRFSWTGWFPSPGKFVRKSCTKIKIIDREGKWTACQLHSPKTCQYNMNAWKFWNHVVFLKYEPFIVIHLSWFYPLSWRVNNFNEIRKAVNKTFHYNLSVNDILLTWNRTLMSSGLLLPILMTTSYKGRKGRMLNCWRVMAGRRESMGEGLLRCSFLYRKLWDTPGNVTKSCRVE